MYGMSKWVVLVGGTSVCLQNACSFNTPHPLASPPPPYTQLSKQMVLDSGGGAGGRRLVRSELSAVTAWYPGSLRQEYKG